MSAKVQNAGTYKQMSASGILVPRGGLVERFICTTNGTVTLTEGNVAGGTSILAALTVVAGTTYNFGFRCPNGAYATLSSAVGTFVV
jgi:hypothetical protein